MRWAALIGEYAWQIAAREVLRSSRWTAEERLAVGVLLDLLIAGPVIASVLVWILTGRGPYRWLGGSYAVVNPFPRRLPPDLMAEIRRRSPG